MNLMDSIEHIDIKIISRITSKLFFIIDIIGGTPIIIGLQKKAGGNIQPATATLVSLTILLGFLFFGEGILSFLGLNIPTFALAGAFVLFILALEMLLGRDFHKYEEPKTLSIVPIAFPLIAGTTSMSYILSLKSIYAVENIIIAIAINMVIVFFALKYSKKIERHLGSATIGVMQKIFGIILLAISIDFFVKNLHLIVKM